MTRWFVCQAERFPVNDWVDTTAVQAVDVQDAGDDPIGLSRSEALRIVRGCASDIHLALRRVCAALDRQRRLYQLRPSVEQTRACLLGAVRRLVHDVLASYPQPELQLEGVIEQTVGQLHALIADERMVAIWQEIEHLDGRPEEVVRPIHRRPFNGRRRGSGNIG
jgi:hypothetical protein